MTSGFHMFVLIAALLSISLVVHAQPRDRDAWGNWGYDEPRDRPWNYCPGCGRPWGPYGGYGVDPRGGSQREHRMEPEQEGKGSVPGPEPGYDYGPYYPGYEDPPYDRERRRQPGERKSGGMRNDNQK